jgi:hypothetical protein
MKDRDRRLKRLERIADAAPIERTLVEVFEDFTDDELAAIIALDNGGDGLDVTLLSDAELEEIIASGTNVSDDEVIEWLYAGRTRLRLHAL